MSNRAALVIAGGKKLETTGIESDKQIKNEETKALIARDLWVKEKE